MLKKKITTLLITVALLTSIMPEAFADTTEQPPQMPTQSQGEQPPAKPDGDQSDGEQPPQMPNGEQPQGDMNVSIPFTDVASDAWYYNVVSQAYGKGLISGMSDIEFSPESSVTGAQLIMMLYRADDNTVSEQTSGNWYDEAVDWAKEKSIISDNNGWTFDANADLTREQMMVLLYNYLQYKGNDLSALDDLSSYTDRSEISAYAENAVKALVGKGIIEGDGKTLRPLSSLTRAETAVILINAVDSVNPSANQGGMQPPSGNMPGGFGGSDTVTQGTSATTITEGGTYSSTLYSSIGDDENVHNVMIYQSMSGDAEVGTSEFDMTGGSLTGNNGDMFYITNTHSIINLSNVDITNKDADAYLMRVTGNSAARGWGKAGANGAQVEFTASNQTLNGDIAVDTVSTLNMTLTDSSDFTGTINIIDNAQNGTAVDNNAVVTIDSDSTWTLTGNCTVTSLENNGTINFNGHTITLADGTVLSK